METVDLGEGTFHRRKDARGRFSQLFVSFAHAEKIIHDTGLVLAWDYRRYVVASMPTRRPDKAELAYTTKKIEANFSNFSAWHQRTKVLGSLWASGEIDKTSSLHKGVLVFFALYTPQ